MTLRSLTLATWLIVGTCLLLVSCGKKAKTKSNHGETTTPSQSVDDQFLEKQDVACETNQICPSFITKIVVKDKKKFGFCTGFLIDRDIVATSTSCLPHNMRLVGENCSKNIFFFFPRSGATAVERVGCTQVLQASQLDGIDPILWRDDLSLLRLDRSLPFRKISFSRNGVQDRAQHYSYMIDQQSEYSAIIKRVTCEAVHQSYVNPLVTNQASPNQLFAGCPMTNGGSGSPILDASGRVKAVVSSPMNPKLRAELESTGLLVNGLKDMLHATNLACPPINDNTEMLDERECSKDLTYLKVDSFRADMLNRAKLFEEQKGKLEESIRKLSQYVEFKINYVMSGELETYEIVPKCFKKLSTWLPNIRKNYIREDFSRPVKSFKRVMSNLGKIQGIEINESPIITSIQIYIKGLRNTGSSDILMWSTKEDEKLHPPISECSLL